MTLFTAHTDFPAGHALTNTNLNDRFTELETILNGGLVDENVSAFTAAVISGTAAVITGGTQVWANRNTFNGISALGRLFGNKLAFADGDTSPDISGNALIYRSANTGPTTIDRFDGGTEDQILFVIANDSDTTINHNPGVAGGIRTGNASSKLLVAGEVHCFIGFDNGGTLNFNEFTRSVP